MSSAVTYRDSDAQNPGARPGLRGVGGLLGPLDPEQR